MAAKLNSGAPVNPMLFDGEYLDPNTGLYDLTARQYDPTTGRFLTQDSINAPVQNPYESDYLFVADQPTVLIDPSGQWSVNPFHDVAEATRDAYGWGKGEYHSTAARDVGAVIENLPVVGDVVNLVKFSVDLGYDAYNCTFSSSQACSTSEWTYGKGAMNLLVGLVLDYIPGGLGTVVAIANILSTIFTPAQCSAAGLSLGGMSASGGVGSALGIAVPLGVAK